MNKTQTSPPKQPKTNDNLIIAKQKTFGFPKAFFSIDFLACLFDCFVAVYTMCAHA